MKTVLINASPRKNWNTAQLLQAAKEGVLSAGDEANYIDLYDLNFSGCRSCLACKRKNAQKGKCYWKDDLSPLINGILQANSLIIGSPVYFGEPTSYFRALFERLLFCVTAYDDRLSLFEGMLNIGLIYTMNVPYSVYETSYKPVFASHENYMRRLFHGEVKTYAACDTLQVFDYSKYDMARFDEDAKRKYRQKQFPIDRRAAFEMGAGMNR